MAHKAHFVVIPSEHGEAVQAPLKLWIRQNLELLPNGFYTDDDTSHMLRRKLTKLGWKLNVENPAILTP